MKKLSKLRLHNVAILNDQEMMCITGGYDDSYYSGSSWCAEGERLFQCYINFESQYYTPGTSPSLGAVCATTPNDALSKSLENLSSWDLGHYAVTCK